MKLIILFTSFFLFATKAFAFGGYGHELICHMAYNALPMAQQQKIDNLVNQLPQNEQALITRNKQKLTFAKACNWPDKIKRIDKYDQYKPWHYLNTTRDDKQITQSDCHGDCVAKGIIYHQQQLSQNQHKLQQAQALLFIGHWVGDLHQPLHVSFKSDLGGNKTNIRYATDVKKSRCKNLHWYWDECLIMSKQLPMNEYANQLNQTITYNINQTWHPSDVWHWADESFQLLTAQSFNYCQQLSGTCQTKPEPPVITQAYQNKYLPVIEQQVQHAAQRLARILHQSL